MIKMNTTRKTKDKKINPTGIILTIIITIFFTWAIYQLLVLHKEKSSLTGEEMQENEIAAYRSLKTIAAAQEKYSEKDWQGDGQKVYAMFYVHLWRSVDREGKPIPVNLIPKKLAFAMDISSPLKGYYFVDLRKRRIDFSNRPEFDYKKEWGVAALPGIKGKTGLLALIVDQSGEIYATTGMHSEPEYPREPLKSGWTKIDSIQELREFQKTVHYPVNK